MEQASAGLRVIKKKRGADLVVVLLLVLDLLALLSLSLAL
jgi:hypothetical protein